MKVCFHFLRDLVNEGFAAQVMWNTASSSTHTYQTTQAEVFARA